MAFLETDEDQKDRNAPNTQNQVPAGQGSNLALPNTGTQSSSAPQQPNQPSSSGSYTNLQKYLDVNQDQAQPLAERVGSGTKQTAADARSAADTGVQQFQTQVQSQVPQVDQDLVKSLQPAKYELGKGPAQPIFSPVSPVGLLATQPASYLTTPQSDSIKKARTATYQGPNAIEDTGLLQNAYTKAQKANDMASQLNTEQGRFAALKNYMSQDSNYGQGQQLLDQAILETHPEARSTFLNLQNNVSGLNNEISQKGVAANQIVAPAKQQIETQKTQVQQQLQSALDQYMQNLDLESQDLGNTRTNDYQNLNKLISGWQSGAQMAPDQANQAYQAIYGQAEPKEKLGSTVRQDNDFLSQFPGLNLSQYIKQSAAPTMNAVANPYDFENVKALQDLAGDNRQLLDESQLGKYLPSTKFNSGQLQTDLLAKLNNYRNNSGLERQILSGQLPNVGNAGNRLPLEDVMKQVQSDNTFRGQLGMKPIDLSPVEGVNFQAAKDWGDYNTQQQAAMKTLLTSLFNQSYGGYLDPSWGKSYFNTPTSPNNYAYQPTPSPTPQWVGGPVPIGGTTPINTSPDPATPAPDMGGFRFRRMFA